jgi:quercetin dioxygenase-like cupin family protein
VRDGRQFPLRNDSHQRNLQETSPMTPQSSRPQATPEVQVDTERLRVTKWSFAPGAETGWHRHGMDYAVVPVVNGTLLIETGSTSQPFELVAGQSYARPAGVEHNVVNGSAHPIAFVEIELK